MKLTVAIFLITLASVNATTYAQVTRLDISSNKNIVDLFHEIEGKSDFYFFYQKGDLKELDNVDDNVKNATVMQILDEVLDGTSLDYKVVDKYIIVRKTGDDFGQGIIDSQQNSVTGKVTDTSNQPLPGVTVMVAGTTNGTVTNADGNYTIANMPEDAVLQFSFVGMKAQEIAVGGSSVINVSMEEETIGLDEVVAIGYGVQKKKLVTGATLQIRGEDIQRLNTVSPLSALQSQSPGVVITQNSGKPGSDYKINIRGIGTIGNYSPLIIIDDIEGGDLNLINPADIESIDVLKDAASAAIYGSRAANGVILVKTKKGKAGKTIVTYDGYYGLQNIAKYNEVLNAQQYVELVNESQTNIGSDIPNWSETVPDWSKVQQGWIGTNWLKEFTNKNAPQHNHSLNISGGSEVSNFSMGFSNTRQEGIYGQPEVPVFNRYSFRLNSEHIIYKNSVFDVVKVGENLLYNFLDRSHNGLATEGMFSNDVRNMMTMNPLTPIYDDNGDFTKVIPYNPDQANPIGMYYYNTSQNSSKSHDLRANAYTEIQPLTWVMSSQLCQEMTPR